MWGRNEFIDDLGVFNADGERIGKVCAVLDDNGKCVDSADALRSSSAPGSSSENVLLS